MAAAEQATLTDVEQRVLAHVDPAEVVRWTQELVRIDSVPRPGREQVETEAARWVEAHCQALGLETAWEWAAPGRPNVIAILPGSEGATRLMFEGHTDVVTEGDPAAWTFDPFGGEIVGGRLYGRGSNDMKGGLVAALGAIAAIVRSGVRLRGDILLGALADEEGLMLGVKDFVARGWARTVTAAVVCEPEDNRLCIAHKGVIWVAVTTRGRMAHGAMPYTGINPISQMARFLVEVAALEARYVADHGRHEFLGVASISPTRIHGPALAAGEHGTNNVIPATAEATLDIRIIPGMSVEQVMADLSDIVQRLANADEHFACELDVIDARPPTSIERDAPIVQALAGATLAVAGREPVWGGVPGSTDGTILHTWGNVPVVTCGPGDTYLPHHVDEYMDIDQLIEATRLYVVTALRYCGVAAEEGG